MYRDKFISMVCLWSASIFFIAAGAGVNIRIANPDWVPPQNRKNYPGYAIKKQRLRTADSWKYATNRPGGNIRGGGTTGYFDYRSVNQLTSGKKKKKR